MSHEEENINLRSRIDAANKELEFAIKFAKNNGVVTVMILEGIQKKLLKESK